MIAFINTFLSYLILVIISMGVIVLGVFCGKKLRDRKDEQEAQTAQSAQSVQNEEK